MKPKLLSPQEFRKMKKKVVNRPEQSLQIECVAWFKDNYPNLILFHIGNERKASPRMGAIMKAMGVLSGVADLCLLLHGHAYFFELKAPKGKLTDSQKAFSRYCADHLFTHDVIHSFNYFQTVIRQIMMLHFTKPKEGKGG